MKPLDVEALMKELARRARIGNGQSYRHAKRKMLERHERLQPVKK